MRPFDAPSFGYVHVLFMHGGVNVSLICTCSCRIEDLTSQIFGARITCNIFEYLHTASTLYFLISARIEILSRFTAGICPQASEEAHTREYKRRVAR